METEVATESSSGRAVFLDRDGTVAPDVTYCRRFGDFHLRPDTGPAVKALKYNDFKIIVITSHSGIARGHFTEETLCKIHNRLRNEIKKFGVELDAIYYCPHHPEHGCACRKPGTGLFLKAREDHKLDFTQSYVIGEREHDIIAGKATGCKTIFINHNEGNSINQAVKPDYMASDMLEAARWILGNN